MRKFTCVFFVFFVFISRKYSATSCFFFYQLHKKPLWRHPLSLHRWKWKHFLGQEKQVSGPRSNNSWAAETGMFLADGWHSTCTAGLKHCPKCQPSSVTGPPWRSDSRADTARLRSASALRQWDCFSRRKSWFLCNASGSCWSVKVLHSVGKLAALQHWTSNVLHHLPGLLDSRCHRADTHRG